MAGRSGAIQRTLWERWLAGDERIQHLATTLCLHQKPVPETMKRYRGEELGRLIVRPLAITTGILHCAKRFAVLRGLSKGSAPFFMR